MALPGDLNSRQHDSYVNLTSVTALRVGIFGSDGVQIDSFGGGGTQYTEGATDATITGNALMMEGAADTLVAAPGTALDGLLVNLGTNNDVTVTGTVTEANSAAIAASLNILDDWDETDRAKVNIIAGQAGVAGGTGVDGATVLRVSLATNVALPAGTNNIGDVDVLTVPTDPFGANADAGSATGSISAKLRFIASTGIPVTGSVTVTATNLDIRDLTSVSDSVSAVQSGTWTEANSAAILTAVQLIDDPVVVLGTATYTEAASKGFTMAAVRRDADTTLVDTTNEFGPLQMDANGRLKVEVFSGEALAVTLTSTTITGSVAVTNAGTFVVQENGTALTHLATIAGDTTAIETAVQIMDDWDNAASDGASVSGDVAHDSPDAGEPVKMGMKAVDLGATPTAVAANDRTNWLATRAGIPFVLGGHPNVQTKNLQVTDADGAQTDVDIIGAVAAGTSRVVTKVSVTSANGTANVSCRIGFGTANTPAADAAKVVLFHPGIPGGGGAIEGNGSGIIGIGASDEELRVTCDDPVSGSISIIVTYFDIAIG